MADQLKLLERALLLDRSKAELHVSPEASVFASAEDALISAFGPDGVFLSNVSAVTPGKQRSPDQVVGRWTGESTLFDPSLDAAGVFLEVTTSNGAVDTILILQPLAAQWSIHRDFDALLASRDLSDITTNAAMLVFCYGRHKMDLSKPAQAWPANFKVPGIPGSLLENGLQILLVQDADLGWAALSKLPFDDAAKQHEAEFPPQPHTAQATSVALRTSVDFSWIDIDRWWDDTSRLGKSGDLQMAKQVLSTGVSTRILRHKSDADHSYFLLRFGLGDVSITLSSLPLAASGDDNLEPLCLRFTKRDGAPIPLGAPKKALNHLVGDIADHVDPSFLPGLIELVSFTYALEGWAQFSFRAEFGSTDRRADKLISSYDAGWPIRVRQIDFNVLWPLTSKLHVETKVELDAVVSIAGLDFDARIRPCEFIEGDLKNPTGIGLGKLLETVLSAGVKLPFGHDTLKLMTASATCFFEKNWSPYVISFEVECDGKVDLIAELPGAIELDKIQLKIGHQFARGASIVGTLDALADLKLGPIAIRAGIAYSDEGWTISGELPGQSSGVQMQDLLAYLAKQFSATVPSSVPDVTLDKLTLKYQVGSKTLNVYAVAEWKFPEEIPVFGGRSAKDKVSIGIVVAPTDEAGHRQSSISVDFSESRPSGHMSLNVYLSSEAQTFSADFAVSDPSKPLTITELTKDIGLPDLPKPGANVLDEVFQVSSLAMDYQRQSGEFSVAWARRLPKVGGQLIMEFDQRVQASGRQRHIEVSWLPASPGYTARPEGLLSLLGASKHWKAFVGGLPSVLSGAVNELNSMLTLRAFGFDLVEGSEDEVLSVSAMSAWPGDDGPTQSVRGEGTRAFLVLERGAQSGMIVGISLLGNENNGSDTDFTVATSRKPVLPAFLPSELSTLLSAVEIVLENLTLDHLILSTVTQDAVTLPRLSSNGVLPSNERTQDAVVETPFGSGPISVIEGVSLGGHIEIGKDSFLRKVISFDRLDLTATIGEEIALTASIPKDLKIGSSANSLTLTGPALSIAESSAGIAFALSGEIKFRFHKQFADMTVSLNLSEEAINAHLKIKEFTPLNGVPLVPMLLGAECVIDLKHPLSFELGLEFEPPGIDIGFQGSFSIYRSDTDLVYGDIGIVIEIVEGIPQPEYMVFDIDELSIPILLEAVTGIQYDLHLAEKKEKSGDKSPSHSSFVHNIQDAVSHVQAVLSKVEFLDVGMHWCEKPMTLPDGSPAIPGVAFHGGLKVFDWHSFAMIDIVPMPIPGFLGHLETEEIKIGKVVRIWGDGKGFITAPKTDADIAKAEARTTSNPTNTKDWFLEPGGPVLHLSTDSSPFLHADLHAEIFGFLHSDIHADITENGFDFDFSISTGHALSAELECSWSHNAGKLEAHGDITINLKGDIDTHIPGVGTIHLNTELDAHCSLTVQVSGAKLKFHGYFEHDGATLTVPEITLKADFHDVESLAGSIWDSVKSEAEHIFAELAGPIVHAVKEGAEEVVTIASTGAKAVAHEASAVAEKTEIIADETSKAIATVGAKATKEADNIGKELAGDAKKDFAIAKQEADALAAPLLKKAEELEAKAAQFASDAEKAVAAVATEVIEVVSKTLKKVAEILADATQWVSEQIDAAKRWVKCQLAAAVATVARLGHEAKEAVEAIGHEISKVEHELSELLDRVTGGAEHFASTIEHSIGRSLPHLPHLL